MELTSLFEALDQIAVAIRDKLHDIESISVDESKSDEPLEFARARLARECNSLILKYHDVLEIMSRKTRQAEMTDEQKARRDIYSDELGQFKLALRAAQLKSYSMEEKRIHQQRVFKYGKVTERTRTTEEMRKELFGTRSKTEEAELAEKTIQDKILQHNKSITASLQSTRQMMTTSILQTELNVESVDQQTKDLSTWDNLLVDLQTTLKKSRNIVKFIEKQDRADKNKIYMSVGFLLLCSAWVIWRRILKLPVKILIWSLSKVFRIFLWLVPKSASGTKEAIEVYATTSVTYDPVSAVVETIVEALSEAFAEMSQTAVTEIIKDEL